MASQTPSPALTVTQDPPPGSKKKKSEGQQVKDISYKRKQTKKTNTHEQQHNRFRNR